MNLRLRRRRYRGVNAGSSPSKGPRAFRNISRELTEEDLANPSPAVLKLLVGTKLDRLQIEEEEYKRCMKRFHDADRKVSVLEQKEQDKALGGLTSFSGDVLTVGGFSDSDWPMDYGQASTVRGGL